MPWAGYCGIAALAVATEARAQDGQPPQQQQDAELVFEREVFDYPSFTRRNPFRPLSGPGGELRFEDLSLIGIMYSPDGANSVAVLSTGGVTVNEDGTTAPVEGEMAEVQVRTDQVPPSTRAARVFGDQSLSNLQGLFVFTERQVEVADLPFDVAELVVAHRDTALPGPALRVGGRLEPLPEL